MLNYKKCLETRKIFKADEVKYLIDKELDLAKDDLKKGKDGFERDEYRWPTIQFYYSMFHSARVLLYSKGYREKSHICLYFAIEEIFGKGDLISKDLLEKFKEARNLREEADYKGDFSKENAGLLLKAAEEFFKIAEKFARGVN